MRILLTNNALQQRGGADLYVRDLAFELLRRGHHPVAYSTLPGSVGDEIRTRGVPVIQELAALGEAPDVIHGQHHYDALSAMLWFSETPAVYFCHGWEPWEETPLRFPRIQRYVAVSDLCRERLIAEGGVPSDKVELVFNFFDRSRFPQGPPLPLVAKRALAFGNAFRNGDGLDRLRKACRQCGLEFDVVGSGANNATTDPGPLLANYDVVFAVGPLGD